MRVIIRGVKLCEKRPYNVLKAAGSKLGLFLGKSTTFKKQHPFREGDNPS